MYVLAAGTPADGGRRAAGGRTLRRAADRWTPRRALRYRGEYMLALWERGDTEGAPSGRQGRRINNATDIHIVTAIRQYRYIGS